MTGWKDIFEPEETVGRLWHRLIGGEKHSYPHYPEAAAKLETLRPRLAVFFRALGGDKGVRLAAGSAKTSGHRLSLRAAIGMGEERLPAPKLDGDALELPAEIDLFADPARNEAMYEWLAAFFAHVEPMGERPADPLADDLLMIRRARAAARAALTRWPGLKPLYADLAEGVLAARPARALPDGEKQVEETVRRLLADPFADDPLLNGDSMLIRRAAPVGYRPFLPAPLWGEAINREPAPGGDLHNVEAQDERGPAKQAEGDGKRRKAKRRENDQTRRKDPLLLNRFEKILGLADMMNLARKVEDDDEEGAKQAADDLDEITVGPHEQKAATRLKLDLELAPSAADVAPIVAERTYPEWDWTKRVYYPDHVRVIDRIAAEEGDDWVPGPAARRRINRVRRQFEALRPKREIFTGQPDGDDIDLNALVRARADRIAGGFVSNRLYVQARNSAPDLAVAVLMDVSLSTDGWVDGRRVLDVEKEALLALTQGLAACGTSFGVYTFTSKKRSNVWVDAVKGFDEPHGAKTSRRIQALRPGFYTRMGAALRHVTTLLEARPQRQKLLLLLSDGKPNDMDHYEGRYGIEDTRVSIREARRKGLAVFGITVDAEARDYFPTLFGRGHYAIFPHVARLTTALPAIYRSATGYAPGR
jgi:nitric oxide reductase NorD protein